ncbi:hypothetical protein ACTMTF_29095 [Nonomuraea sp. ZG12]|uniref:hypothetical protein n=1 Tax=Nonomuraea sp. ZG12 TaxID=3452207 RepID=UPI003F8C112B
MSLHTRPTPPAGPRRLTATPHGRRTPHRPPAIRHLVVRPITAPPTPPSPGAPLLSRTPPSDPPTIAPPQPGPLPRNRTALTLNHAPLPLNRTTLTLGRTALGLGRTALTPARATLSSPPSPPSPPSQSSTPTAGPLAVARLHLGPLAVTRPRRLPPVLHPRPDTLIPDRTPQPNPPIRTGTTQPNPLIPTGTPGSSRLTPAYTRPSALLAIAHPHTGKPIPDCTPQPSFFISTGTPGSSRVTPASGRLTVARSPLGSLFSGHTPPSDRLASARPYPRPLIIGTPRRLGPFIVPPGWHCQLITARTGFAPPFRYAYAGPLVSTSRPRSRRRREGVRVRARRRHEPQA